MEIWKLLNTISMRSSQDGRGEGEVGRQVQQQQQQFTMVFYIQWYFIYITGGTWQQLSQLLFVYGSTRHVCLCCSISSYAHVSILNVHDSPYTCPISQFDIWAVRASIMSHPVKTLRKIYFRNRSPLLKYSEFFWSKIVQTIEGRIWPNPESLIHFVFSQTQQRSSPDESQILSYYSNNMPRKYML